MDSALGPMRRSFVQWRQAYRRYWVRPGRTRAWWDNFLSSAVVDEKWKENFRMCKVNFYKLCEELCPFIEKQTTFMCSPVEVERQVALTLYYLSDVGQLRKTANAFELSRACVSITIRRVTYAITNHMGPHYCTSNFQLLKKNLMKKGPISFMFSQYHSVWVQLMALI